jgi:hypothetical protein
LRRHQTVDRILTERYHPEAAIILDALEIPDFDMRTNGLQALKAMVRVYENADKLSRAYYPNEFPIHQGNELKCPCCKRGLDE